MIKIKEYDSDNTFMLAAIEEATKSLDQSTQNGAVIVDDHFKIISQDHNRFPDGVYQQQYRLERPDKYDFVEHAERAAIYRAALLGKKTQGGIMYCPWAACPDCARAIVLADIHFLVRYPISYDGHWGERVRVGDQILLEGDVRIIEKDFDLPGRPKILRNGVPW